MNCKKSVLAICIILFFCILSRTNIFAADYPTRHGKVVGQIKLPTDTPIGLTFGPGSIIFYTDCWDWWLKKLIKYDYESEKIIWEVRCPSDGPNDVVFDGEYLWSPGATGSDKWLYKFSPEDGALIQTFPLPNKNPSGIEFIDGVLYIADWEEPLITKFSIAEEKVIGRIKAPHSGIFGLAWDGRYLWCAPTWWPDRLMPMDIEREDWICKVYPGRWEEGGFRGLRYKDGYLYLMNCPNHPYVAIYQPPASGEKARIRPTREITVLRMISFSKYRDDVYSYVSMPPTDDACQEILRFEHNPPVKDCFIDKESNRYGKIKIPETKPDSDPWVSFSLRTKIQQYETEEVFFPHSCGSLNDIPEKIREVFLSDHPMLDIHHPIVQQCAQEAAKGETNPFWLARNIILYLSERLTYGAPISGDTAPAILESKGGVCNHFARACVAVCRAAGLPARHVRGEGHHWVEVYMPGPGEWLTTDRDAETWMIGGWSQPILYKRTDLQTSFEVDNTQYSTVWWDGYYLFSPGCWRNHIENCAGKNWGHHYSFTPPHRVWNEIGESSPAHTGILGVKILDATSVKLVWDPALTWDDDPVEYEVYISTENWDPTDDTYTWNKEDNYYCTATDTNCTVTGLSPGTTYYALVLAKNNEGLYSMPVSTFKTGTYTNHNPVLSSGDVDPDSGNTSTEFHYTAHYYDEDGDSPTTKKVYIDGSSHTMTLSSGSASNGTYRYPASGGITLSGESHNYYFYFTDGNGGSDTLPSSGTYSGPTVAELTYTLTVNSAYDSPSPSVGSHIYNTGTAINASVDSSVSGGSGIRYVCTGWTGTGSVPSSGSNNSVTFTINQNSSITWDWKTQYYLTIDSAHGSPTGEDWYDSGVTANWSVNSPVSGGEGIGYVASPSSGSIIMNSPQTVSINWKTEYRLQASSGENGSVSPSGTYWYDEDTPVTLNADPNPGYGVDYWTVNSNRIGEGQDSIEILIDEPKTVAVYFKLIPDTYSISGTISYSGSQTGSIYIGAFDNPEFTGEKVGGNEIPSPGAYTIENLSNGEYYVDAYMDVNGNGEPDEGEPEGKYPGNPVVIDGANQLDINFALRHFNIAGLTDTSADFSGTVTILGIDAQIGDEVGAFDPDGICCGAFTINTTGIYGYLHVYGDDPTTEGIDEGAVSGDTITFKIWDKSEEKEYFGSVLEGSDEPIWQNQISRTVNLNGILTQRTPLREGWNLFSFSVNNLYYDSAEVPDVPLLPGLNPIFIDIGAALSSIEGKYEVIRGFDKDGAHTYVPTTPQFNDLHYLSPGYGYWIKMEQERNLNWEVVD